MMSVFKLFLIVLMFSSGVLVADIDASRVEPFLKEHCISCHGEKKQKGDIRLDQFDKMNSEKWQLVYEQLYHEEMPPSDERQPSKEVREEVMAYILSSADERDNGKATGSTGYRKMNQREYNHTVRDLLGLNQGDYSPGRFVYSDTVEKGFDTEAESLVMSSELLLEYLNAAEKSVNQALFTEDYSKPDRGVAKVNLNKLKAKGKGVRNELISRDGGVEYFSKLHEVEVSGMYKISITAEPVDDFVNYDGTRRTSRREMVLGLGGKQVKEEVRTKGVIKKSFKLKGKRDIYTHTLWLEKGYSPFIKYENGPGHPPTIIRRNKNSKHLETKGKVVISGIKITGFEIEGPIVDDWPPESYRVTYAKDEMPDLTVKAVRDGILYKFLARACRRIPSEEEVALYRAKLEGEYFKSKSWHDALVKTFSAIMVSPDFLYIRTGQGELSDFELASRLSYFFWSSMPDKELFKLAHKGKLKDPEVYAEQIARMYRDPKSQRFMDSFATQWLSLDKLGSMPPDKKGSFSVYYDVEKYFRKETVDYFKYVLLENRSVNEFIDSDYTFLNSKLASFYKVPFKKDTEVLEMVKLPVDSPRGGIITHGSILTLTANGVETSPIERGHWILDELMGTPPPPPPKEVAAITPDLRGIKTIREQLIKHRADPNCIQCHLKMDPPGFAMESFDAIGRFRTHYSKKSKVDTGGLFLGSRFNDINDFKKVLLKNNHIVARNLVIKLAEYAKGRKLNLTDLRIVDEIVRESSESDYAFRSMLGCMLKSDLMMKH